MQSIAQKISAKYKKSAVVDVRSGDTVKVHQKIREGGKERVQIFEGLVIRVGRTNSLTSTFTARRVASGVGVEKTYLIHSPSILKVEVVRRSKVRRNRLNYMRDLTGKSARLSGVDFDKESVNAVKDDQAEAEEEALHARAEAEHLAAEAKKAEKAGKQEAKVEEALGERAEAKTEDPEAKDSKS